VLKGEREEEEEEFDPLLKQLPTHARRLE